LLPPLFKLIGGERETMDHALLRTVRPFESVYVPCSYTNKLARHGTECEALGMVHDGGSFLSHFGFCEQ